MFDLIFFFFFLDFNKPEPPGFIGPPEVVAVDEA